MSELLYTAASCQNQATCSPYSYMSVANIRMLLSSFFEASKEEACGLINKKKEKSLAKQQAAIHFTKTLRNCKGNKILVYLSLFRLDTIVFSHPGLRQNSTIACASASIHCQKKLGV